MTTFNMAAEVRVSLERKSPDKGIACKEMR